MKGRTQSREEMRRLGEEYRRSGQALVARKKELQRQLHGARSSQQKLNLRQRMAALDQLAAETFRTAAYLLHYYDEEEGSEGSCHRSA